MNCARKFLVLGLWGLSSTYASYSYASPDGAEAAQAAAEEAAQAAAEEAEKQATMAAEEAAIEKLKSDPKEQTRGEDPPAPAPHPSAQNSDPSGGPQGGQGYTPHSCLARGEQLLAKAMEASAIGDLRSLGQLRATQKQGADMQGQNDPTRNSNDAASQAQQSGLTEGLKGGCRDLAMEAGKVGGEDCQKYAQSNPSDAQNAMQAANEFRQHAAAEALRCDAHSQDAQGAREALEKNKGTFDKMKGILPLAALAGLAAAALGGKKKDDEKKKDDAPPPPPPPPPPEAPPSEEPKLAETDTCKGISDAAIRKECYCSKDEYKDKHDCNSVAKVDPQNSSPTGGNAGLIEGSSGVQNPSQNPATAVVTGRLPAGTSATGPAPTFAGLNSQQSSSDVTGGTSDVTGSGANTQNANGTTPGTTEGATFSALGDSQAGTPNGSNTTGDVVGRSLAAVPGDETAAPGAPAQGAAPSGGAAPAAAPGSAVKFTMPVIQNSKALEKADPCLANPTSQACKDFAAKRKLELQNKHSGLLKN